MAQVNISQIRSKNRAVTHAISRDLYEHGAAGLRFRSNRDDQPCVVLLEGRAHFVPNGKPSRSTTTRRSSCSFSPSTTSS
jgi:hypothetical protein